ncbi:MAG: DNA cytosine methyltransferase [Planctomycetota bacterium]|nr:DNA cytosine methyltransferase [Planctomycetota bacterium]
MNADSAVSKQKQSAPRVIDLFCGAGGFSLGAARAGFNVVYAADLNPIALETHGKNFPSSIDGLVDVSKLTGEILKSVLGGMRVDGIVGGPPCQGFSSMGKRDQKDPRNRLFYHFFRIVSEVRPSFFVVENVPGILSVENDKLRNEAFALVKKRYSLLSPICIAADQCGAPTTRERIFFIGLLKDELPAKRCSDFQPPKNVKRTTVSEALKGLPRKIDPNWQSEKEGWRKIEMPEATFFGRRLQECVPNGVGDPAALQRLRENKEVSGFLGTHHTRTVRSRFASLDYGRVDKVSKAIRLDPKGFCPTLRAGTGKDRGSYQAVRPIHPTEDRVITPREAARLQGFPDWFVFSATKWHSFQQIGNSVSPIVSERVLKVLFESLKKSRK